MKKIRTVVSVCNRTSFDWQAAIEYEFMEPDDAINFLKLSLSQGYQCLVFDEDVEDVLESEPLAEIAVKTNGMKSGR